MSYVLHIIKNQNSQKIPLLLGQTVNIQAEKDTIYQIIDENGQIIFEPKSTQQNQNLALFLEENEIPNLIIENYYDYSEISDFATLQQLNATFAISNHPETVLATQKSASFTPFILGGLGIVGAAVALAGSNDDNKQESTINNQQPKDTIAPELKVSIQEIPKITLENIQQNFNLSGELSANENLQNQSVKVLVNGIEKSASIQGKNWTLKVSGNELAKKQGMQKIEVIFNAEDLSGNSATAKSALNYEVNTLSPKPTIEFNPITGDNLINLAESQGNIEISGQVKDFKKGDRLNLKIGESNSQIITLKDDGSFSLWVDGKTLINHANIQAALIPAYSITKNDHRSAFNNLNYKVDLEPPKPEITLNPIAGDNKINLEESKKSETEITGKVSGTENNNQVILICSCTTCTGRIDKEIPVILNPDNTFSVSVKTNELLKYDSITAKVQTEDEAKNIGEAENSQTYELDKNVPATPTAIKLNPITGDNIITVDEGKINQIEITGQFEIQNLNADKSALIELLINGKTYTTKTELGKKDFSILVDMAGLLADNQIYATVKEITNSFGNINSGSASTIQPYFVESNQKIQPQIYLNPVSLDLTEEIGSVRLSGKIDFSVPNQFSYGYNKLLIDTITLKIGQQNFDVVVSQNDYSFYLDLTKEQYNQLKGKEISYQMNIDKNKDYFYPIISDYNDKKNIGFERLDGYLAQQELEKLKIIFNDENIQNTNKLDLNKPTKIISGEAIGGKVGDIVNIKIGNQIHQTAVKENHYFEIQIDQNELKSASEIQATVTTGNETVSDIEKIEKSLLVSDNFVNHHKIVKVSNRTIQHSDKNYNFPYFIDAVNITDGKEFYGWLEKIPLYKSEPSVIKYYFVTQQNYDDGIVKPEYMKNPIEFNIEQKKIIREVYNQYESLTNLKFIETQNILEADTKFMMGENDFSWKDSNGYVKRYAGYASSGGDSAYVTGMSMNHFKSVVIHEIFHTLGAEHANKLLEFNEMKSEFSSMLSGSPIYRNSLQIYDLAYLHYRFGINPNYKTGDDVYRFKYFNPNKIDGDFYIWDGSGVDTFDASIEKDKVYINLTPGSWIYRGSISNNFIVKNILSITNGEEDKYFYDINEKLTGASIVLDKIIYQEGQAFIGYGTQIENAIGSEFDDTIIGNKADNNLYGMAGNDEINAQAGNDYINGGKGADKMSGGLGDDIYIVDNSEDLVIENASEGADMVYSAVDYTLTVNVENLELTGKALSGTGNELDNSIIGNDFNNILNGLDGDDSINGGRGSDTMTGGNGKDKFIFNSVLDGSIDTIADFDVNEDKIVLDKNIFKNIEHSLGSLLGSALNYDKSSGLLSFNNGDLIYFAKLNPNLDLNNGNIEVI